MYGILNAVQAGASSVLTTLGGLGADIAFGVRNYQDFALGDPYAFPHEVSPTNVRGTTTAAISSGSAIGGGHLSEGQLLALSSLAVPAGGAIGRLDRHSWPR